MANHPLTEKEIFRISKILSSDCVATAQKDKIYGQLGLDSAGLEDLKRRVLIDGSDSHGFFSRTLSNYKSMMGSKGTVNSLKEHFQELNLTNVVEKIGTTSCAGIWYNIPFPVELFTGRKSELARLHESITCDTGVATVINHISAVFGLGGIGKSELAKKYAQDNFTYFNGNGIWIDAETEDSFRRSVVKLLEKHFDTPQDKSKDMNNNELMQIVYDHFVNQKCLIIFDNVEDYDVIKLLPKSMNPTDQIPSILITSRKSRWMVGVKVLSLDLLSIEDAIALVNKSIKASKTEDVLKLVNTLQCLPLALQQALAYIRAELPESVNPIGKYLQLFESQKIKELLNYKNEEELAENEKTTLTTWSITMQNIKAKEFGTLATRIMNLISCFDADNIPVSVFEKLHSISDGSNVSSSSSSATTNEFNRINIETETRDNVDGAVALLKKYSMITGPPGVINIHRLVQCVVQLKSDLIIEDVLREGLVLLENYMGFNTRNDEIVKSLLPHAENIWRISMRHTALVKHFEMFPSKVCKKLHYYGRYAAILQLAQDSKSEIITISGDACESAIHIRYIEATALASLGKHTESLEILKQILPISEVKLGIDHELTHLISNMVTLILPIKKGAKEKIILHEKILAKQLKSTTEHKKPAAALQEAMSFTRLGRYDEALKILESLSEVYKRALGDDSSQITNMRKEKGYILFQQGKIREALGEHVLGYESQKRIIGIDHPEILHTMEVIQVCQTAMSKRAVSLFHLGILDESLELLQNVYETMTRVQGEESPNTLNARIRIAEVLWRKEMFGAALEIFKNVHETRKLTLGVDHPTSLETSQILQFCQAELTKMSKLKLLPVTENPKNITRRGQ